MMRRGQELFSAICDRQEYRRYLQGGSNKKTLQQAAAMLTRVLNEHLTERQRQLVYHYYYEGKSQREIAAMYGVHPATVSRTLSRARVRIESVMRYWFTTNKL